MLRADGWSWSATGCQERSAGNPRSERLTSEWLQRERPLSNGDGMAEWEEQDCRQQSRITRRQRRLFFALFGPRGDFQLATFQCCLFAFPFFHSGSVPTGNAFPPFPFSFSLSNFHFPTPFRSTPCLTISKFTI